MRRTDGHREGPKSMRRRVYRKQLGLDALVYTRGPDLPARTSYRDPSADNRF